MRITRFGAAAVAASLTFGGALAFADEVMPEDPTVADVVETTTTTSTTEVPPTTTTTVADEGEDGDGDAGTKDHPDNHGKIVSQTAHDTPPGPGHGKAVSEVARSKSKGKPHKTTTSTAAAPSE